MKKIEKESSLQKEASKVMEKIAKRQEERQNKTAQLFSEESIRRAENTMMAYLASRSKREEDLSKRNKVNREVEYRDVVLEPLNYDNRVIVASIPQSLIDEIAQGIRDLWRQEDLNAQKEIG